MLDESDIIDCYNICLGREPDIDGIRSYKNYKSKEQVLRNLLTSNEFKSKTDSNIFDITIYRLHNPDLYNMSNFELIKHFCKHGLKENRIYSTNSYNYNFYKEYFDSDCNIKYFIDNEIDYPAFNTNKYLSMCNENPEYFIENSNKYKISEFQNDSYLLISHDTKGGSPKVLLEIYKYLKRNNKNVYIFFPYYDKSCYIETAYFYNNDPILLITLINSINPSKIIFNSWNMAFKAMKPILKKYNCIFYSHEFKCHYHNSFIDDDIKLYCVGHKIQDEYQTNKCEVHVSPPFYIDWTHIDNKYIEDTKNITDNLIEIKSKIIIGGSGSIKDIRKNFEVFKKVAKSYQTNDKYMFMWIGGEETIVEKNLIIIKHTQNPYKYMKYFDYFLQVSLQEPCAYTNIESLYLGIPIVNFTRNVGYIHKELKYENHKLVILDNGLINVENLTYIINSNFICKKHDKYISVCKNYVNELFSLPKIDFLSI